MSNFNEENLRDGMFEILDDMKASLVTMKRGSEEESRVINNIVKIAEAVHNDYKIANTIEQDRNKANLDERKFLEDARQKEREQTMKEDSAISNNKWYNKPIIGTIFTTTTVATVCMAGMLINSSEQPLKNGISQWIVKAVGMAR